MSEGIPFNEAIAASDHSFAYIGLRLDGWHYTTGKGCPWIAQYVLCAIALPIVLKLCYREVERIKAMK
jgi:hypothetical protein